MSTNRNAILQEVRTDDWRYDPWGTGIAWLFAICEVLYAYGYDVPDECEYRPSPRAQNGPESIDPEDYQAEQCIAVLDSPHGSDVLWDAAIILARWDTWCRMAGRNY